MVTFEISEEAGYRGCGRAWAAVKDGKVVKLIYMGNYSFIDENGNPRTNHGDMEFSDFRIYSRSSLSQFGEVVGGMCSCWTFCC